MHDYIISSYKIDLKNKTIEICAEDAEKKHTCTFLAEGVLTHLFQTVLENNIILDIYESNIEKFIEENLYVLEKKKQEGWPINYENLEELKVYLNMNEYRYIIIRCSYGLQGWILAKYFKIS